MKKFITAIKNIWNHEELRGKILLTLGILLIYRVGSWVLIPGVDYSVVSQITNRNADPSGGVSLTDMLGLFTGGAFNNMSIFALGVMPYISASIVIQLLGLAVPSVQKLQKEGESGRRKINQWTRFLTVAIALVQGPGYIYQYVVREGAVQNPTALWTVTTVIILTCSTLFVMWLGEKITDKGIGNGTSLIIMTGIVSDIPGAIAREFSQQTSFFFIIEIAVMVIIIGLTIAVIQAVRRIAVTMPRMASGGGYLPQGEAARSYIPLRLNASGVMPIIFAQAIMFVPMFLQNYFQDSAILKSLADYQGWGYNLLLMVMIILFTFFYTAIVTNPQQIADDLKRNNNFVIGFKPGKETADEIERILDRITLPGGIFVALIAIMPAVMMVLGLVKAQAFSQFFGGTSILITVGVILDLLQQIESHLLSRHYDGLMQTGRVRGRNSGSNVQSSGYI